MTYLRQQAACAPSPTIELWSAFTRRTVPSRPRSGARLRGMTEYQVTRWRELPSMVAARAGDEIVKAQLASRFQEAIDEAAMRLGETGAQAYLARRDSQPAR